MVFGKNDCFKELNYLHIGLTWLEPLAVRHFLHYFVGDEESPDLIRVHIVLYQFIEELKDQNTTMVKLLLERNPLGISLRCLLLFIVFHFLVLHLSFVCLFIFSFRSIWRLFFTIRDFEVIFCYEIEELVDNFVQDDCLESLLHLRCLLANQIFEELAYAHFDPHLTRIYHVAS